MNFLGRRYLWSVILFLILSLTLIGCELKQENGRWVIGNGTSSSLFLVHFADIHLATDPEIADIFGGTIPAVETTDKAVQQVLDYNPDVFIQTGDIVAHAEDRDLDTAENWFILAKEHVRDPIVDNHIAFLYAPGNHDRAGIKLTGVDTADPRYDEGLILQYLDIGKEKVYYSYDKGDYHFVVIDPEELPETGYRVVSLPEEQLNWLKSDLEANKDKFIIISYHQPLGSWTEESYQEFMNVIEPYKDNVILLAGHTHDNRVIYRNGIPEYQDGAVCGDWWQTGKTPDGNPIGYAIYYLKDHEVHRFYKAIDSDKQINLLAPVDVTISGEVPAEFNIYDEGKNITSVCYEIDGNLKDCFDVSKVDTPKIDWYHVTGTIDVPINDGDLHHVTIVATAQDGSTLSKDLLCKFSEEKIMPIADVIDDYNFENFYGRFVKVDAVITAVMASGNLLTLQDDTGSIVVWAGDCHHPEFNVGDKVRLRGQVTQFKGTKELKLVSQEDVEIYDHVDLENLVVELENIKQAYDQYDTLENKIVKTSGVVTAIFGNLVFIQDDTQGIALWLGEITAPSLELGDKITVKGGLTKYNGMVEIVPLNDEDLTIDGTQSVPDPKEITLADIDSNYGTLVVIKNVEVTSVTSSKIYVSDGNNQLTIYCGKAGFNPTGIVTTGDKIDVTGVVGYYGDEPQIYPRSIDDIVVVANSETTPSVIELSQIKDAYDQYTTLENKTVKVSGTVTAVFGNLVFIQDESQGIALWLGSIDAPELAPGDILNVKGTLTQYNGMVEIVPATDEDVQKTGTSNVPEPKEITIKDVEANYGTLVTIKNVEVTSVTSSKVVVSDGNSNLTIYCGKAGFDPSELVWEGAKVNITGVVGYYLTEPQIYPRNAEDLEVVPQ